MCAKIVGVLSIAVQTRRSISSGLVPYGMSKWDGRQFVRAYLCREGKELTDSRPSALLRYDIADLNNVLIAGF